MNTTDLLKLTLKESDLISFRNYLQICDGSKLFQRQDCNIESTISFVNSLLNVSSDYEKGVLILKVLLPQCKSDVLGRYLFQWLQHCLKALQSERNNLITSYFLLRDLIIYSKHYPDVRKQTSILIIPKFMEFYFKSKKQISTEVLIPFLSCLEHILLYYGKACVKWKEKIEKFLFTQLECPVDIAKSCAKCFINLSSIAPTTLDLDAHKDQWYRKQKFLISLLHTLMNSLFDHTNEIQGTYDKYINRDDSSWIPEISDKPLKRIQRLTVLFVNAAEFLRIMLLGTFPVGKRVFPDAIFSVVCRGLSITCTTLEASQSNDSLILSTQIPAIHLACLSILDAMIQSCGRSLLAHGELICKIISQTLKWTKTSDCEYGQNKPYSVLRVKAYHCLSNWLTTSRISSFLEQYIAEVTLSILSDIHNEKPPITLSVSTKRLKGKIGKRERKKNNELLNMDKQMSTSVVDPLANKEVCKAALDLLPSLLEATSFLCSPNLHKQLQEAIVSELLAVQAAYSVSLDLPIPYSDESCRLALYTALLALCNHHHPKFPAPCNYAVHIFNVGLADNSILISRFCGQAIANVGKMLHPIGPTLNYPLQLSNEVLSRKTYSTIATDSSSKVIESNCENITNGHDLNEDRECNLSVVLESIPRLFTESTSTDHRENVNEVVELSEDSDPQEIQHNQEKIRAEETVDIIEITSAKNNNTDKESEIVEHVIRHEEIVEKPKTMKRSNIDIIDDVAQEKRRKEENEVGDSELEKEMLGSFVDIVM